MEEGVISTQQAKEIMSALMTYAALKNANEDRKQKLEQRKTNHLGRAKTSRGKVREMGRAKSSNGWGDIDTGFPAMTKTAQSFDPLGKDLVVPSQPAQLKQHHTMIDLLPVLSQSSDDDDSSISDSSDGFMVPPPEALANKRDSQLRVQIQTGTVFGNDSGISTMHSEVEIFLDRADKSLNATKRAKIQIDWDFGDLAPSLDCEAVEADGSVNNDLAPLTLDMSNLGASNELEKGSSLEGAKMYSDFEKGVDSYHSSPTNTQPSERSYKTQPSERSTDADASPDTQPSTCLFCCCSSRETKPQKQETEPPSDPDEEDIGDRNNTDRTIITVTGEPATKGIYTVSTMDAIDGGLLPIESETSEVELASIKRFQTEESQIHIDNFLQDPKRLRIEHMMELDDIGAGAGGVVSAAMHMPMCRVYALKTTQPSGYGKDHNSLVENEMKLFFWIKENLPNCPQLVKYHECFILEDSKQFAIVMDLADLGSLKDYMEYGNYFNAEQLRHIARETCLGLQALHGCRPKPLLHRDIKPDNILLSSSSSVFVADYGLVYQLESPESLIKEVKGTVKYCSPECQKGNTGDGYGLKSDVWSLGISLYEISVGEFFTDSDLDFFTINDQSTVPNLRGKTFLDGSSIPDDLIDFVDCCLKSNPDERLHISELLQHPFISDPPETAPSFVKKDSSIKALEKMVDGLLMWINQSKERLGITKPFPKPELNGERVRNISDFTNYTFDDLHKQLRSWTDAEKLNLTDFSHKIRASQFHR